MRAVRVPSPARRLAVLLSTTCLTTSLALTAGGGAVRADGGRGGDNNGSAVGGAGGSGYSGAAGQAGSGGPGGGGGGGAGGGAGGAGGPNGISGPGGTGGIGGTHGNGSGAASIDNTGTVTGTAGGQGGMSVSSTSNGGGGGGGAGGYGAIVTGATANTNTGSGTITGARGGRGGNGQFAGRGGSGGDGGVGLQFTTAGATLLNAQGATIAGGAGGIGGTAGQGLGGTQSPGGAGGVAIVGEGLTIVNAGTIQAGVAAVGAPSALNRAIVFTGGTNVLELHSTSNISGVVVASSSADTLRLGGTTNGTFYGVIGANDTYRNFGVFEKTGSSTWTIQNYAYTVTPWTVSGGTLAIYDDLNLGTAAGTLTLAGGGLRSLGTVASTRNVVLGAGAQAIDTNNNTTITFNGIVSGDGGLTKSGAGTLVLGGTNTYLGDTIVTGGTLALSSDAGLGGSPAAALSLDGGTLRFDSAFDLAATRDITLGSAGGGINTNGFNTTIAQSIDGAGALTKSGTGTLTLAGANTYGGGTIVTGGTLAGTTTSLQGDILNNAQVAFNQTTAGTYAGNMSGTGALLVGGPGTLTLSGLNTYSGGTAVSAGASLQGTTTSVQGNIANNGTVTFAQATAGTYAGSMSGSGSLTVQGGGTLTLTGSNSYTGGTSLLAGALIGNTASLQGNILNNGAVTFDQTGSGTYAGGMSGSGSLTVQGGGTLTLTGSNSYTGGTSLLAGALIGNSASLQGDILNNGAVIFNQTGSGTYAGNMSGIGSLTVQGGGTLTVTGANTYTGATTVNGGMLVVNGSLTSTVTLSNGGTLGGSGNIGTLVVSSGGLLAPGNSIGTLNVNGNLVQNGGSFVVEANAQGQSDRVNVSGTATLTGGTVVVQAQSGTYATSTTYTILSATGGVSGAYASVSSNFAFLTPTLAYTANDVLLTLALQGSTPFSGFGGNTANQRAVGSALDQTWANASGDFATVVGALANLSTTQAGPALDAIGGQQYADFGTTNVAGASLFMNTLGQQMANARNGSASPRVALAQACDVEACDDTLRLSAWFSGLGGLGSVQGNGNSSTLTYNVGGGAAGIDYRLDPRFLVGLGVGYAHGTQWVNSFMGQGWTDSVSIAAYGSFTQAGFYADALAGYAYANNQMQRQIQIPGLQQRTASGSTGANQFLAQVEAGYRLGVWDMASVTPFARFQTSSTTQNAFTESGATSLNLNVAQQTTTSLRSVLGAAFGGTVGPVGLNLRLGWQHEYANTGRPISASFAGAPSASFTVYGATPTRDSAIVGVSATANVATATQLYLRYDGELASGTDNHAITAGLRLSW